MFPLLRSFFARRKYDCSALVVERRVYWQNVLLGICVSNLALQARDEMSLVDCLEFVFNGWFDLGGSLFVLGSEDLDKHEKTRSPQ